MARKPIQIEAILFRKASNKDKKNFYEYLILKRIPAKGGFWQPVTGGVEDGETPLVAVKREVEEETGITNLKRIVKDVHYFAFLEPERREEYVFGIEVDPEQSICFDKNVYLEHDELRWCSYEEALSLLKWQNNKDGLKKLLTILNAEKAPTQNKKRAKTKR